MRKPRKWLVASGIALGALSATTAIVAPRLSDLAGRSTLQHAADAFQSAAVRALPSVVSIKSARSGPFGIGSGVFVREDGLILTNFHVVEAAEAVTVSLNDERKFKAEVLGTDPLTDLAVLRLQLEKPERFPAIELADSDQVKVGDWALAVGTPFGLVHSVTSGIISAKGRGHMGVYDIEDFLQTDAAINPGNSGGPLVNLQGKMIGLNAAIFSQTGGFIGIGFSISSNLVRTVMNDLMRYGHVRRGWIGAAAQDLDSVLARYFRISDTRGALITGVDPSGPAAQAALSPEDVVVSFNSQPVKDSAELQKLVIRSRGAGQIPVEVMRNGKRIRLTVTIREQPPVGITDPTQKAGQIAHAGEAPEKPADGLIVRDIPSDLGELLGPDGPHEGALVVAVRPGSQASTAGISPGDVILKANRQDIRSARQFERLGAMVPSGSPLVLFVQRGPAKRVFVPIAPEVP